MGQHMRQMKTRFHFTIKWKLNPKNEQSFSCNLIISAANIWIERNENEINK
jgi:hypothetical protein